MFGHKYLYIFHTRTYNIWFIGYDYSKCNLSIANQGFISVHDSSSTPDKVKTSWKNAVYLSEWKTTTNISVVCDRECTLLILAFTALC